MTKQESLLLMAKRVGDTVRKMAGDGKSLYTPFMAAASNAVSQRIASVDFVLDLRDARIPLSSECELLRRLSSSSSSRRIVVLNKVDLASRSNVKEWTRYFERESFPTFGVNSHNKDNIQEFLGFLQSQVRALKKAEPERHTITMMLVGIPNVGKSALANSLHHIGRISAAEKGNLKHAVVSPIPGETKGICSLKVASHPSIYILDTPGILPPQLIDVEVCAKLALTGALRDNLAGEKALAQYFLSVLNFNHEYQKWEKLSTFELPNSGNNDNVLPRIGSFENKTSTPEIITDHTQDSVVLSVRRSLFEAVTSFRGNLREEEELLRLIKAEFDVLKKAFKLPTGPEEDIEHKVAVKLLNLFRTGRLGHYILDSIPVNIKDV
ncbi:DAR GTPase 2, mitochondrial-like [Chenopodium quinoa]|uniref:CP-type G domain-containing protein n=1 Tax=Chenopodium quinoa TaxID=63459 RepID=A0A803KSR9_CHEQI|nr:DAR GTPase 2, mitochondrial-like [Chenopodium quinoa]